MRASSKRRLHLLDGRDLLLVGRHERDHLLGAVDVAGLQVAAGEAGERHRVLLVLLQHGSEDLGCGLHVAFLQRLLGGCQHGGDIRLGVLADEPVDEGADGALRLRAHEAVERTAIAEGIDRRQRLHAQLPGDARVLVDVDLHEPHLAAVALDDLLEHRRQLLARPAPRRPEVDDDRHVARGLDDVLGKARRRRVLDDVGACPQPAGDAFKPNSISFSSRRA